MSDPTKDAYGHVAKFYDRILGRFDAPLRTRAMKLYPVDETMRVLDVGCGTGNHLPLYIEAGAECHGIDLSPSMLEQARSKLGDAADIRLGDATALPYDTDSFDLVVASLFLHELDSSTRSAVLSEVARVVKSSGRVLVIDYRSGDLRMKGRVARVIAAVPECIAGRTHFSSYRSYLREGGIPEMLTDTGLTVETEKPVSGGNLALWLLRSE